MKKALSLILMIIILINSTFTSISYADTHYTEGTVDYGNTESLGTLESGMSGNNWDDLMQNGAATVTEQTDSGGTTNQRNQKTGFGAKILTGVLKLLMSVLSLIPTAINWLISLVTGTDTFTIGELLGNQYELFKIDFWNANTTGDSSNIVNPIRTSVITWYYTIRNIAVIGMVVILVYLGIRLSLILISSDASSAKERARYKKLLISWLQGLALMFILHYIMIAIIMLSELLLNILVSISESIQNSMGSQAIEQQLVNNVWSTLWAADNDHPFWTFVIYMMLVYYQLKFVIVYMFRSIKIYFYVVVSPLVCLTYSIDKIGDGKSQAFDHWLREFMGDVLIQPIQLIVYTIFILSASQLISSAPILMVILLASLSNLEKIIIKIMLGGPPKFSKSAGDIKLTKPDSWAKT